MDIPYNFIVIEGNIGAGKTTLAQKLAEDYQAELILEQFRDNPFLPKFYQNPERYSFTLEMSFLTERYHQLKHELHPKNLFSPFVIADYYFMKSLIFARANLEGDEYNLYRRVFDIMFKNLPMPDLFVYLHASADKLLRNIRKRGRNFEQPIRREYLLRIQENYFNFFHQFPNQTFLIVNTDEIDYVKHPKSYEWIKHIIFDKRYEPGINRVSPDEEFE